MANNAEQRFNDAFIADVIEAVKNNTAPWQKTWHAAQLTAPQNAQTGNLYSGRNAVRLNLVANKRGYSDPRWATYNQIRDLGGQVNKGEHATGVLWYTQKTLEDKNGDEQIIHIAKHYNVFNIQQTNLPVLTQDKINDRKVEPDLEAFAEILRAHAPKMLSGEPAYSRVRDTIYMPDKAAFINDGEYYSTVMHEMSHWTGHESRLNRDLVGSFGSAKYAQEELIAELSSYMLALERGLPHNPTNTEAYLQHWAARTDSELETAMLSAFTDATRAQNYITAPLREKSQEKESVAAANYTLHNRQTDKDQPFSNPKEAGAAFFNEPSADQPVVYQAIDNHARTMAFTTIQGTYENGETKFVKELPDSHPGDAEFREGFFSALEKSVNERLGSWDKKQPLDNELNEDLKTLANIDTRKAIQAWQAHVPEGTALPQYADTSWEAPKDITHKVLNALSDKGWQIDGNNATREFVGVERLKPEETKVFTISVAKEDDRFLSLNCDFAGNVALLETTNKEIGESAKLLNERAESFANDCRQQNGLQAIYGAAHAPIEEITQRATANEQSHVQQDVQHEFWQVFYKESDEAALTEQLLAEKPIYLAVDYADREEAKSAGARWDAEKKSWYAPPDTDLKALDRYLPKQQNIVTGNGKTVTDLVSQAAAIGVDLSAMKSTYGKWQRAPITGRGTQNQDGAYKLFNNPDGTIGAVVKNLVTDEKINWSNREAPEQSKENHNVITARLLNQEMHTAAGIEAREKIAAQRAIDAFVLYKKLDDVRGDEPYLCNKQTQNTHGLKRLGDGSIVVPLISHEKVGNLADKRAGITSLQVIKPDGDKRLMKGAQKVGSYFPVGSFQARKNPSHVFIAEGMATADAVSQVMRPIYGDKVLVLAAIDCKNLQAVAAKAREMYPAAEKFIAADNDGKTKSEIGKNPGLEAAHTVKEKYPEFAIVASYLHPEKNQDFSDCLLNDGFERTLNEQRAQKKMHSMMQQKPATQKAPQQQTQGVAAEKPVKADSRKSEPSLER